jgi:hypothetical protein
MGKGRFKKMGGFFKCFLVTYPVRDVAERDTTKSKLAVKYVYYF